MSQTENKCRHCNGTGRIICPKCNGCGMGLEINPFALGYCGTIFYQTSFCRTCGAIGKITCTHCNGTGKKNNDN